MPPDQRFANARCIGEGESVAAGGDESERPSLGAVGRNQIADTPGIGLAVVVEREDAAGRANINVVRDTGVRAIAVDLPFAAIEHHDIAAGAGT